MGKKDYNELTPAQLTRDLSIVGRVRKDLVVPLLEELEAAIPSYSSMGEWERFISLMKLNEDAAIQGDFLMLDFGRMPGKGNMRGAVYTGEIPMVTYVEHDGVKVLQPWFQNEPNVVGTDFMTRILGAVLVEEDERFEPFPLPFRVAAIALYLRQNVVIAETEACRFAAGLTDEPKLSRCMMQPLESELGQRYGWNLVMRDTLPENEFALHAARSLRASASRSASSLGTHRDTYYGVVPLFAEYEPGKKQTRSRHETTESLVDFIDRYLPSHGYYIGRSGEGERITWEQALSLFNKLYPKLSRKYNSAKSFADSYYNARKARKGQ